MRFAAARSAVFRPLPARALGNITIVTGTGSFQRQGARGNLGRPLQLR